MNTRWRIAGQSTVNKVGIWMKKLSVIASENNKTTLQLGTTAPDGKDWRTEANLRAMGNGDCYRNDNPTLGAPQALLRTQYFYLPAFGLYHQSSPSVWQGLGNTAYYWSSSAGLQSSTTSMYNSVRFAASRATVNVNLQDRRHGMVVGQGWFQ